MDICKELNHEVAGSQCIMWAALPKSPEEAARGKILGKAMKVLRKIEEAEQKDFSMTCCYRSSTINFNRIRIFYITDEGGEVWRFKRLTELDARFTEEKIRSIQSELSKEQESD